MELAEEELAVGAGARGQPVWPQAAAAAATDNAVMATASDVAHERRRAQCRAAQARYRHSAKGRATTHRYVSSAAGRAMHRKYRRSPKGLAARRRLNQQRLWLHGYIGHADTLAQADAIRQHIKARRDEFKQRQSARAETEGAPAGAVSAQAAV